MTPYLYLSAATALTPSALSRLRPSLVINVTSSLPMLTSSGLRLAVEDSVDQDILSHLDRVTAAIRSESSDLSNNTDDTLMPETRPSPGGGCWSTAWRG